MQEEIFSIRWIILSGYLICPNLIAIKERSSSHALCVFCISVFCISVFCISYHFNNLGWLKFSYFQSLLSAAISWHQLVVEMDRIVIFLTLYQEDHRDNLKFLNMFLEINQFFCTCVFTDLYLCRKKYWFVEIYLNIYSSNIFAVIYLLHKLLFIFMEWFCFEKKFQKCNIDLFETLPFPDPSFWTMKRDPFSPIIAVIFDLKYHQMCPGSAIFGQIVRL